MSELEHEQQYWTERDTERKCRILGTITHRIEIPIADLKAIDGLQKLSIFNGFQQSTNFRVTPEEGQILMSLAS